MSWSILHPNLAKPLLAARYLGDYDAIVVEPIWETLIGITGGPGPGEQAQTTVEIATKASAGLQQRSNELQRFIEAGGVLVIKVQARSSIWGQGSRYDSLYYEVDSIYWFVSTIRPLAYVARVYGSALFLPDSGRGIEFREVGHPLEDVVRDAKSYSGTVAKEVLGQDGTTLLAATRIGDPVAVELVVGSGLVLLVPSGVDDAKLDLALAEILQTRARHRQTWLLPQERSLVDEERALRAGTSESLKALAERQRELADLRTSVMQSNLNLARAVAYYENGTSPTRSAERAMQDLHKLVDLLEDYFGGSEEKLATGLGVDKSRFKHIKKLANQPKLDIRHAASGVTEGADAEEVDQAREDARVLVQRFIEVECNKEVDRLGPPKVRSRPLPPDGP